MESQNFKPIFKNGQIYFGIWEAIILEKKGLVHFLVKDKRITSEIYINQVFNLLDLLFHEEMILKKRVMIKMDDSTVYHILKFKTKFYPKISLLHMNWPIQSLNLNFIENL